MRILQNQHEFASQAERQSVITLAFGMFGKSGAIRTHLNLSGTSMNAAPPIGASLPEVALEAGRS